MRRSRRSASCGHCASGSQAGEPLFDDAAEWFTMGKSARFWHCEDYGSKRSGLDARGDDWLAEVHGARADFAVENRGLARATAAPADVDPAAMDVPAKPAASDDKKETKTERGENLAFN